VAHLTNGEPFISTNTPEGHIHEEWSIEEVLEEEKRTAKPLSHSKFAAAQKVTPSIEG
jgi:hypothetical protein